MGIKERKDMSQIEMFSIEQLVPNDHLVRKLEKAINLDFIYPLVQDLYSDQGRESIDPVVLIRINIIQYTFGIRSMRQTIKDIEVNFAYRWYLGYGLNEKIPHFSTFSKNFTRRFSNSNLFSQIFQKVVDEVNNKGFIEEENIFIDGSHLKANANNHKSKKAIVEKSAKYYEDQLKEEIREDREIYDKKQLKPTKAEQGLETEIKYTKASITDPDCGVFHKGEHKKVFAYTTQVACDKNCFVLAFTLNPGNVHDSFAFPELYSKVTSLYKSAHNFMLDSGYKTPPIAKMIIDDGNIPVLPYKRPMTKDGFFKKYEYTYDEKYDCFICENNHVLKYVTTNRNGYREYKSNPEVCASCPYLSKCTHSKNHVKLIQRHVWEEYMEQVEDIRHTKGYKDLYKMRSETIERVFADAKELHGMRYAKHRGMQKVTMELNLLFSCMNLKKLANKLWNSACFKGHDLIKFA